jgi:hypothetical protein
VAKSWLRPEAALGYSWFASSSYSTTNGTNLHESETQPAAVIIYLDLCHFPLEQRNWQTIKFRTWFQQSKTPVVVHGTPTCRWRQLRIVASASQLCQSAPRLAIIHTAAYDRQKSIRPTRDSPPCNTAHLVRAA